MYRFSRDLDLSSTVGAFTTQVRVGQFDLQFTFASVNFIVNSPVDIFRNGALVAHWEAGRWPDPGFYDVMNVSVTRCEVVNETLIVMEFENGLKMHLVDDSDQYECMQIQIGDSPPWII